MYMSSIGVDGWYGWVWMGMDGYEQGGRGGIAWYGMDEHERG